MYLTQIQTSSKMYPLFLGKSIIPQLPLVIRQVKPNVSKIMIITDQQVDAMYGMKLTSLLSKSFSICKYVMPKGEKSKNFMEFYKCLTFALEQKLDRQSLIIALGGGVVGDLAGFVAASYMRGISWIQVPTTLLAHDSAVGGKVAINHPLGKNLIGAFYQPDAVLYDIDFLYTLPKKELKSGFAELIKHALISKDSFYEWLKNNVCSIDDLKEDTLAYAIRKGIEIKASIIKEDEKENDIRTYLNFGHTLGHAIEVEKGYGEISHGEAVVIGMVFALRIGREMQISDINIDELEQWLTYLGYNTRICPSLSSNRLIERMKQDKKNKSNQIHMVILKNVGSPMMMNVDESIISTVLKASSQIVER